VGRQRFSLLNCFPSCFFPDANRMSSPLHHWREFLNFPSWIFFLSVSRLCRVRLFNWRTSSPFFSLIGSPTNSPFSSFPFPFLCLADPLGTLFFLERNNHVPLEWIFLQTHLPHLWIPLLFSLKEIDVSPFFSCIPSAFIYSFPTPPSQL